jgi:SAM-dependent methyltransferase
MDDEAVGHREVTNFGLLHKLAVDKYGIWSCRKTASVSYPEEGNLQCFKLEDNSFWFRHRNDCILAAIKRFPPTGPILDVGGGNGFVTRRMIDEGFSVALLEPGPIGAFNAKKQRYIPEVLCSTLEEAGFLPSSVSAIGLFDVIEHIKDDRAFVKQIHNILKPGGILYATVPAHEWLWSLSDVSAQHFRRYNHKEIVELLDDRFEVLFITYLFGVLTLPIYFMRSIPFKLGLTRQENLLSSESEHGTSGRAMTSVLSKLLKKEVRMIASGRSITPGTSCLWVARKRVA